MLGDTQAEARRRSGDIVFPRQPVYPAFTSNGGGLGRFLRIAENMLVVQRTTDDQHDSLKQCEQAHRPLIVPQLRPSCVWGSIKFEVCVCVFWREEWTQFSGFLFSIPYCRKAAPAMHPNRCWSAFLQLHFSLISVCKKKEKHPAQCFVFRCRPSSVIN